MTRVAVGAGGVPMLPRLPCSPIWIETGELIRVMVVVEARNIPVRLLCHTLKHPL